MSPRSGAVLVLALFAARVNGQPKVGQVQPDQIVFGKVHSGAIVEASFLIYAAPSADGKAKFEITAPPFVKVLRKDTDAWTGAGGEFARGTVEFAIDTAKVSEFSGAIAVTLNSTSAQVPVSATVRSQRAGLLRLLVVETPFQRFSTNDGRHFSAWTDLVAESPWDVSYLLVHRDQPVLRALKMSDFDAVILGTDGVFWLQPADLKRLRRYVEAGGAVIVAANYFFRGTVEKANAVLARYGVTMADTEAQGENARATIEKTNIDPRLVKAGIARVSFHRGSPLNVTNPMVASVLVNAVHVGKPSDGFVASANAGNGKIFAIG